MLWEQPLDEAQQTVKSIESSGNRPQKKNWLGPILAQPAEKDISSLQRQTELRLFSGRCSFLLLALGLLEFYDHFNDKRNRRCSDIIRSTARTIKKDSYPLEPIQKVLATRAWIFDLGATVAESSVSLGSRNTAQVLQEVVDKHWPLPLTADAGEGTTA